MSTLVKDVTDITFREAINQEHLVIVDFYATWCGPCRVIEAVIEELAATYEGKISVFKADVDKASGIARQESVKSIPTIKFYKGTKELHKIVGASPKKEYIELIEKHL